MKKTSFNKGWKFWTDKNAFALVWDVPDFAKTVTLPHDAMLEQPAHADSPNGGNTGFRDGGVYQYVRMLTVEEKDAARIRILQFEGVYMNAMVYVNGELAKKCPYGYTGFTVELNDFLRYGEENEIRVIVRNSGMTNSRWYSGGGIYRDVWMLEAGETYLAPEGVQVTTESLEEDAAVLRVETVLKNRASRPRRLNLLTEICDADGQVVASERIPVTLFAGESRRMTGRLVVPEPQAWSAEAPYLYEVRSSLYGEGADASAPEAGAENGCGAEAGDLLDTNTERFGIRTLAVDAKRGFRVNGKRVKLRGACIHHDSGVLGAATYYAAEYRRVRILKEAGFNAIRMSHHPAAPALLCACDALGMYVMDEAFDMWQRCKSDNDYGLYFDEWWERDVEAMVRKDYNHPSVILYSVGNEIPEIGMAHGAKVCHDICGKIKSMDVTRYTLASINGVFAAGDKVPQIMGDLAAEGNLDGNVNDFMTMMDSNMDKIVVHDAITERLDAACANTDIAGYNYMTARYELDGKCRPNRVIVGSETYPPEIARNWALVEKLNHVIGDFTWTGWDYIGEAGVGIPAYQFGEGGFGAHFPCQLAYCGDIDITGFRRPASYFREIVFGLRREPYIAVQNPARYGQNLIKTPWVISDSISSWTYPGFEGKPVVAEVYAPGDEVELFCNGRSLGKKAAGSAAGYRVLFETVYEPGTLVAVSYEAGRELGRMELSTAGENRSLVLEKEVPVTAQCGKAELVYVAVASLDEKGTVADDRELMLTAELEGDAEILGFGSANPKPSYNYTGTETETFHGRAQLVIKKNQPDAPVKLRVCAGEESAELTI